MPGAVHWSMFTRTMLSSILVFITACGTVIETDQPQASGSAKPPTRPHTEGFDPQLDGQGLTLVVRRWRLNESYVAANGENGDAWRRAGFDLDGLDTRDAMIPISGHCRTKEDGYQTWAVDGDDGRDNTFARVAPLFLDYLEKSRAEDTFNGRLEDGHGNLLLHIPRLPPPGVAHSSVEGTLHRAGALGFSPTFDAQEAWPFLEGEDQSFMGYVTQGQWVSGFGPMRITLPGLVPLELRLSHAIIVVSLDDLRGTVAGVLDPESYRRTVLDAVPYYDAKYCDRSDSTLAYPLDEGIADMKDILADGSQDENAFCDGISLAIEFEAVPVRLGPEQAPLPLEDPCGP